jgi:hypothetical protein
MANREISSVSSPVYSALYTLAVGQFTNVASIPNYLGECSKILGIVKTTALVPAGASVVATKGAVVSTVGPPATVGYGTIRLSSSDSGDVNSYRIYWTNEVADSSAVTVQGC